MPLYQSDRKVFRLYVDGTIDEGGFAGQGVWQGTYGGHGTEYVLVSMREGLDPKPCSNWQALGIGYHRGQEATRQLQCLKVLPNAFLLTHNYESCILCL